MPPTCFKGLLRPRIIPFSNLNVYLHLENPFVVHCTNSISDFLSLINEESVEDHFSSSEKFIDSSIYHRERQSWGKTSLIVLTKKPRVLIALDTSVRKGKKLFPLETLALQILVLEILLLSLIINQA